MSYKVEVTITNYKFSKQSTSRRNLGAFNVNTDDWCRYLALAGVLCVLNMPNTSTKPNCWNETDDLWRLLPQIESIILKHKRPSWNIIATLPDAELVTFWFCVIRYQLRSIYTEAVCDLNLCNYAERHTWRHPL